MSHSEQSGAHWQGEGQAPDGTSVDVYAQYVFSCQLFRAQLGLWRLFYPQALIFTLFPTFTPVLIQTFCHTGKCTSTPRLSSRRSCSLLAPLPRHEMPEAMLRPAVAASLRAPLRPLLRPHLRPHQAPLRSHHLEDSDFCRFFFLAPFFLSFFLSFFLFKWWSALRFTFKKLPWWTQSQVSTIYRINLVYLNGLLGWTMGFLWRTDGMDSTGCVTRMSMMGWDGTSNEMIAKIRFLHIALHASSCHFQNTW